MVLISISAVSYLPILLVIAQRVQSMSVAEEWTSCYKAIFEQTGQNLTDLRVMKHMTFMYETRQEVATDSSITKDMRDNVQYWYRALTDTNGAHCNVDYMDGVRRKVEHIGGPTPNLVALFALVHSNLKEFCSDMHLALKDTLNTKFDYWDKSGLTVMHHNFVQYSMGKLPRKKLGKELFHKLGVLKTCSSEKIRKAWRNGPCGKLNTYMKQIKAPLFDEFVKLVDYHGLFATEPHRLGTIYWAKVVHACNELEQMIPDLARDNNIRTVTGRKIKAGLDSLGYRNSREVL